jgi:hypothetical protein
VLNSLPNAERFGVNFGLSPAVAVSTPTMVNLRSTTFTLSRPAIVGITGDMGGAIYQNSTHAIITDGLARLVLGDIQVDGSNATTGFRVPYVNGYSAAGGLYIVNVDLTKTCFVELAAGTHTISIRGGVGSPTTATSYVEFSYVNIFYSVFYK